MRTNVFGVLASIFVGLAVLSILDLEVKFFFAPLLACLTFFMYQYLTEERNTVQNVPLDSPHNSLMKYFASKKYLFLIAFYTFLIAVIVLVPPLNVEYIEWYKIPGVNWLRLTAGILLTTFLPGFVILRFLARNSRFSTIELVVFSFLISIFSSATIGYALMLSGRGISEIGVPVFLGFNIFLIFTLGKTKNKQQNAIHKVSRSNPRGKYRLLLLFSVVAFVLATTLTMLSSNFPWRAGDQDRHFGAALTYLKVTSPDPLVGMKLTLPYPYPYWFHLYLSSFFALSGFPLVNAFISLNFLRVIPILAFYIMVSAFFEQKNSKIPVIATVLATLFQGFGWVNYWGYISVTRPFSDYGLYFFLRDYLSKTWGDGVVFWPTVLTNLFVIGIPSFLLLLYLMRRTRLNDFSRYTLMTIIFALGYLGHMVETLFFVVIFFLSVFLFRNVFVADPKKTSLSIASALLIVTIIDLLAFQRYYTTGEQLIPFILCTFLTLLVIPLSLIMEKRGGISDILSRRLFIPKRVRVAKMICAFFILYLFGLSVIIWSEIHPKFVWVDRWLYSVPLMAPWYFYPMKFGVAGILALAGLIYLKFGKKKGLYFFSILVFFAILLERTLIPAFYTFFTLNYVSDVSRLMDRTFFTFMWIGISVLAAATLVQFFSKRRARARACEIKYHSKNKARFRQAAHPRTRASLPHRNFKKFSIASLTLSLIIIVGMGATLLQMETFTLEGTFNIASQVSAEELSALNHLRLNCPPDATVVTVTRHSAYESLGDFAGIWAIRRMWGYPPLLEPRLPETVFNVLNRSGAKYMYMASRDLEVLSQQYGDGFIASHLIHFLPVAFRNEEVTIYEVPPLSPPKASNSTVVLPIKRKLVHSYALDMVALAQLECEISSEEDYNKFNHSTIMLTYDSDDYELRQYIQWVKNGGHMIVLNSLSHGNFASYLSIMSNGTTSTNGVLGKNGLVSIPEVVVPVTFSIDNETEVISSYIKDDHLASVFAFRKKVDAGEIIYLEVSPILSALTTLNDDVKRNLFTSLGMLLEVLDLPFLSYSKMVSIPLSNDIIDYDFSRGDANFTGLVEIESSFFLVASPHVFQVSSVNIIQEGTSTINGQPTSETMLQNITIQDLQITGSVKTTITTSQAQVVPFAGGLYSLIKLDDEFNLTLQPLTTNTMVTFNVVKDDSTFNVVVQNSRIMLSSSTAGITVLSKTPLIMVQGQASFDEAHVRLEPYEAIARNPLSISGNISLRIDYSDNGVNFISDLSFNSRLVWKIEPESFNHQVWNEMTDVPWGKVLLSPWNLLLLLVIVVLCCVLFDVRIKEHVRKFDN